MKENYLSLDIFIVDVVNGTVVNVAIECISIVFTSNPNSIGLGFANVEILCNKQCRYFWKKNVVEKIT